jgi:hypothetical protein
MQTADIWADRKQRILPYLFFFALSFFIKTKKSYAGNSLRIMGAPSVTAIECSKCADIFLSLVTTVQPSRNTSTAWVPRFTMGSMARTMPGRSLGVRSDRT